jgi:hypothetical protein
VGSNRKILVESFMNMEGYNELSNEDKVGQIKKLYAEGKSIAIPSFFEKQLAKKDKFDVVKK